MTEEKIEMLKYNLNLVRNKWHEIYLSCTPKRHMLYECDPDILLNLNGFCDVGEDAIVRWYQIRMRRHNRIMSLRSAHNQKQNQAKHELIESNTEVNNVIADIKEKTKRKRTNNNATIKKNNYDRKKSTRVATRNREKIEIENEDRSVVHANIERSKEVHLSTQALQSFINSWEHSFFTVKIF